MSRIFVMMAKYLITVFPFDKKLENGVTVACGNVDGDKSLEIVVGATKGHEPTVRLVIHGLTKLKKIFGDGERK